MLDYWGDGLSRGDEVNRRGKGSSILFGMVGLAILAPVSLTVAVPTVAASTSSLDSKLAYLGTPTFFNSSSAVVPGRAVSLHWNGGSTSLLGSGVHLIVTSSVPNFSSSSVAKWPANMSPAPKWNGTGWETTATAMSVSIPTTATAGAEYQVSMQACTTKTYCTPPKSTSLVVPPAPTTWTMKPYDDDYSKPATFSVPRFTQPFAITFLSSDNSIWNAAEYSHDVLGIPSSAKKAQVIPVTAPAGSQPIFQGPFSACNSTKCIRSSTSALSEQVTTSNGWVWLTFGGWRVYANGQRDSGKNQGSGQPEATKQKKMPANNSEVVAFNPATKRFCTYLVPGNNTQVAGIAAVGSPQTTQIWFVASDGPGGEGSLDEFDPSTIGGGCDGKTDKAYELPASVKRLTWPSSGAQWPAQIAVDPSSPTVWISNFNPYSKGNTAYSGIDRVDVSDPAHPTFVKRFLYPTTNLSSFFGAKPWDIVAPPDSDYIYAADNGDAEIVRINKVTNQLQEVPIPLTTDLENVFGLAISSGKLYFTLANDYTLKFGTGSSFGYLDLSSWPADGPPTSGVIYAGLPRVTDARSTADYRAIAVGPTGQVALTDLHGLIRLTPKSSQ
jgi:hypothetical protein